MQKGKGYRRGLDRGALILALAFIMSGGECRAVDSWQRSMGGVIFPSRDHPAASGEEGGFIFALVSAANPFSIPGLYESTGSVFIIQDRCSSGMWWEHTGLKGYSRDRLAVSGGLALPGGFIHTALIVMAESRNVEGYGRETEILPLYSLTLEFLSIAVVDLTGGSRTDEDPVHATIRAGNSTAFLILTLGRDRRGGRVVRAGGSVSVAGGFSLMAGYDMETAEASGGLAFRAPFLAAVSWSMHPVLGTTFSVSVGAVQ